VINNYNIVILCEIIYKPSNIVKAWRYKSTCGDRMFSIS